MPKRLRDMQILEGSLVDRPANKEARVVLFKREGEGPPTKTEDGTAYPQEAYAYVPDPEKPSTWKLRLWDSPDEKETAAQVGRAVAALGEGFRGNRVEVPAADLAAVKDKVRAAWRRTHPDAKDEDMPGVITKGGESMATSLKDRVTQWFQKMMGMEHDKPVTFGHALMMAESEDHMYRMMNALRSSMESILASEAANKGDLIRQTLMQFAEHCQHMVDEMMPVEQRANYLAKAETALQELTAVATEVSKAGRVISKENMDRIRAAMKALEDVLGATMPKSEHMEETMEKGGDAMDEQIVKRLTALEERLQKAETDNASLAKRAEDAEKRVKDAETRAQQAEEVAKREQEHRVTQEYLAKADQYKFYPGTQVEKAQMLRKAYEVSKEYGEQVEAGIKQANAALESGDMFKSLGHNKPALAADDPQVLLQKGADEYLAKHETLTPEQAYAAYIQTPAGKALYAKVMKAEEHTQRGVN